MSKKGQISSQVSRNQHSAKVQPAMTGLQIDMNSLVQAFNLGSARPIIESLETKRPGSKLLVIVYNDMPPAPSMFAPPALRPLMNILSFVGKIAVFLNCQPKNVVRSKYHF